MSAPVFRHTRLDDSKKQIRLVQIHSLTGVDVSETISCTVITRTTEHYTAVSYEWGHEKNVAKVEVNGQPFEVRTNLHNLLLQLRESCPSLADTYFWIDQLCIDQQETDEGSDEKANQVAIMGDIYAQASDTIVWLGKGLKRGLDCDGSRRCRNNGSIPDCVDLCSNDYWSRLWIVQEICFSKSVSIIVGRTRIAWDEFVTHFRELYETPACELSSDRFHTIQRLIEAKSLCSTPSTVDAETTRFRLPLGVALNWFSGLRCKDPRDQLFAIMSLVRCDQKIPIDYSIMPKELFMQVSDRTRAIYPSPHDHAAFCLQLLTRLELENSNDVEVSLSGSDRCFSKIEILQWREGLCQDPSDYQLMTTTAGRTSSCSVSDATACTGIDEQLAPQLIERFLTDVEDQLDMLLSKLESSSRSSVEKPPRKHRAVEIPTRKEVQRLACPMAKRNPIHYDEHHHGPCKSSFRPTSKALMEHLKKQHSGSNRCRKCWKWFSSAAELRTHQIHLPDKFRCDLCCKNLDTQQEFLDHVRRAQCGPVPGSQSELFSEAQEEAFRSLGTRLSGPGSAEDKWKEAYKMLFPGDSNVDYTSPYYGEGIPDPPVPDNPAMTLRSNCPTCGTSLPLYPPSPATTPLPTSMARDPAVTRQLDLWEPPKELSTAR